MAVTICLTLGIAVSRFLSQYSFATLACGVALLICAAVAALQRSRLLPALTLGLCAIGLCGLLLSLARRDSYGASDLRSLISRSAFPLDEPLAFDGCVVEESRKRGEETVSTVELRAIRKAEMWIPCEGAGMLKVPEAAPGNESFPQIRLRYGDRVRGWATWHVPRNYQNPGSKDYAEVLRRRGVFLVGRAKSPRLIEAIPQDCVSFLDRAVVRVRTGLRGSLQMLAQTGKEKESAILASVVLGDYSDLDAQTREAFQNTGTYHVLVVSGLHVAWIAWVLVRFFRLLRVPKSVARVLSAIGIYFYTCVIGFQASISRCLWMFILYLIGQSLFRRASPTNILFASALILLVLRPDWLSDAGFQLSFLSVMAICQMAVPLCESTLRPALDPLRHIGDEERLFLQPGKWHRLGRRWRFRCELLIEGCKDRLGARPSTFLLVICRSTARLVFLFTETIIVSSSVQIWLEMVLAYHFNRLSWISPFANIIAVPASSLVLAAGMASGLLADVHLLRGPVLAVAGFLASFLYRSNQWMSEIPGAWQRCPTPPAPWVLIAVLIVSAWCFVGRKKLWIACFLVVASLGVLSAGRKPSLMLEKLYRRNHCPHLRLTFLDVGEGDAAVIRFPDNRVWVVDAGGIHQASSEDDHAGAFDIGEAVVSRFLWWGWVSRLNRLVISHPDVDHAGGAQTLLRNFRTDQIDYGETPEDTLLSRILIAARMREVTTHRAYAGETQYIAGTVVHVLNPPEGAVGRSTNENSLVLRIVFGDFAALLTGDLEKSAEVEMLAGYRNLISPLLKVAHHGSRSATLDSFLESVRPRWAIISVGRNNPFGHPSHEVLLRLLRHGVRPILTLDQGAIAVETDGRDYVIESHVSGLLEKGLLTHEATSDLVRAGCR